MTYKLKGKCSAFWKKLSEFEKEASDIIKAKNISKSQLETWVNQIVEFVSKKIAPFPEEIINTFQYSQDEKSEMFYQMGGLMEKTQEDILRYRIDQFKFKLKEFNKLKGYFSVINSLQDENIHIGINSIKEKLDFVLDKLYMLYGDSFYSISIILETNNIKFRENESLEICNSLDKKGYIIREELYSNKDTVKLSLKGAEYIERKRRSKNNSKREEKAESNINKKIDEVIRKLEELGYGQEIVFNEIEELRVLSKKLNKKTWSQVVKGKVLDLALSELISKEIASLIYESLVDDKFKLLK